MKYPFTPERLDALPEGVAKQYRQLEEDLLNEICTRLNISGQINVPALEAIKALRSHGISLDEIKKEISKRTGVAITEVEKLLRDVSERNEKYYNRIASEAEITAPDVWLRAEEIDAIIRQTKGEMENITRSMGFAVRVNGNVTKLLDGAEAYRWALDRAEMKVQSGVVSYNEAIKEAVKELADSGIKTVRYDSDGKTHYDSVDVAVRRAVMTGTSQMCSKYVEQSIEYLDTDLVEVTAHIGARDKGIGPENHKGWQGKVYQWVKDGKKRNPKYKDFVETTGYGTGEGLYGWNCRHSFYPFIEGVSERTWTDEQLEHIDDGHNCTYEGKEYTAYEATQKQRQIERTIRKLKREKNAYKEAGLKDDARNVNIRMRRLNQKYTEFSKEADLPEQKERMKVLYGDGASEKDGASAIFMPNGIDREQSNAKGFNPVEYTEEYKKFLKTVPEKNRMILEYAFNSTPVESTEKENVVLAYDPTSEKILYNEKHKNFLRVFSNRTLTHELAHRIDHMFSLTDGNDTLHKAIEAARKKVNVGNDIYIGYGAESDKDGFISDIFSALDNEPDVYDYYHSLKYWSKPGNREREIFANIFSLESIGDTGKLDFLRLHFPEIMREYDKIEMEV